MDIMTMPILQTANSSLPVHAAVIRTLSESAAQEVHYLIADPTGNITLLVLDPVPAGKQPAAAAELMEKEPSAEQVGFLTLLERSKTVPTDSSAIASTDSSAFISTDSAAFVSTDLAPGDYDIALRMAGGEFCGNASMSAAAYYAWHAGLKQGRFTLRVSGTDLPVTVEIDTREQFDTKEELDTKEKFDTEEELDTKKQLDSVRDRNFPAWIGRVHMPPPAKIELVTFPTGGQLPVVTFDGITHVIIREGTQTSESSIMKDSQMNESSVLISSDASFFPTVQCKLQAENLAREWCEFLHADALGLLFLNASADRLTPLVYVPGAETLFWETSCGSGSAAVGAWLAQQSGQPGQPVSVSLTQPGGTLHVTASPDGPLLLQGSIQFI